MDQRVIRTCKTCDRFFFRSKESNGNYCSPLCGRVAKELYYKKKVLVPCVICGEERKNSNAHFMYCCIACYASRNDNFVQGDKEVILNVLRAGIGDTVTDKEMLLAGFKPNEVIKLRKKYPDSFFPTDVNNPWANSNWRPHKQMYDKRTGDVLCH